jgi:flagellar protein FliO/FliZ
MKSKMKTHGATLARVTRAACAFVLFAAVGALGCAVAFAQQAPQAVPALQAAAQATDAPTRPFGAPSVAASAAPSGIASLGQVTLALGLVLALIFVAAWLMRRLRGFGRPANGALDIIADLPVGQKERAVLIRVGSQQVLIGVAPGRVSTLHVLDEPVSLAPANNGPAGLAGATGPGSSSGPSMDRPTFKSLLMKSLGK